MRGAKGDLLILLCKVGVYEISLFLKKLLAHRLSKYPQWRQPRKLQGAIFKTGLRGSTAVTMLCLCRHTNSKSLQRFFHLCNFYL